MSIRRDLLMRSALLRVPDTATPRAVPPAAMRLEPPAALRDPRKPPARGADTARGLLAPRA